MPRKENEPKWLSEARKHDRAMEERTGRVTEPTKAEIKLMEQRQEERKIAEENTKTDLLEKFVNFIADPLGYLHTQVSMGEWSNKEERYELYSLLTAIRTQETLQGILEELKKGK